LNSADHSQPLAIIGIGCLFPGAADFAGYWANIVKGVDGITEVPPGYWRPEDYFHADPKRPDFTYANRGGFLSPISFNPAAYGIAPNSIEATDTAQLLGLIAAQQALEDAGYAVGGDGDNGQGPGKPLDRSNVSVILGVTGALELVIPLGARLGHPIWRRALKDAGVEAVVAEDVVQRISDSYVAWQESSFPGLLGNVVAGRIANRFDLGGTNCVVDAACASSLSAIHLAAMELQTGRADLVVTGGIDTFNDIFMYMCFSKTPALSPTGSARPFDADADGTILGEGLGVVILKRLPDAWRDGDRVYAVIRGMGTSSDGRGNAIYAPKTEGQVAALEQAYRVSGVTADTIELLEAHGTGTKVGDATEVAALSEVFRKTGRSGTWCALGSVKSQIGHTKAAAGAAGLIKAAAALYHKVLPPTIEVKQPTEPLRSGQSPFYLNTEKRPWMPSPDHPRRAGVSAFGFGGSNFHCVLEEADPRKAVIDWDGDLQILAFVGDNHQQVVAQLASFSATLKWDDLRVEAARSREIVAGNFRMFLVVERDRTNLVDLLASARASLDKHADKKTWRSSDGVYYGSGLPDGQLAMLFPGQGAQYTGMLRDLACHFPQMHEVLAAANGATPGNPRLSDLIYPLPTFDAPARMAKEAALRATDVAQPALGAVSLGAFQVLQAFGVKASAFAGHSYGEVTALCAAGFFAREDLFAISRLRGRLMAAAGHSALSDPGSMLAVQAAPETVAQFLREENLELTLANNNSPQQTVLSGPSATIELAAARLTARQFRSARLAVAAAFHSPLVAAAEQPFRAELEQIPVNTPRAPVYANTTAKPYPHDARAVRDLLAGQMARPVEFVSEIEEMHRAGVRAFLEVGPRTHLTSMVDAILAGRDHESFALDGSSGQRSGFVDLASTLAWLASLGYDIHLALWDDGAERLRRWPPEPRKPVFTVELGGANYVKPKPKPSPTSPLAAKRSHAHPPPMTPLPQEMKDAATPMLNGAPSTSSPSPTTPAGADGTALAKALQVTRATLAALQRMQEQTAQLHRQFLEGQESAQRGVQLLIEQQQRLLQVSLGLPAPAPPPLAALPPPPVAKPQAAPIPVPPAPVAAPLPAVAPTKQIETILLEVIAEKTGYPPEMLELDMALDADLGIDSIKRVEILSALQERLPDAPQIKPEHLGTLHNLRQIVAFLANGDGAAPAANGAAHAAPAPNIGQDQIGRILLEIISEKTGYPPEMLELDMALDADLGIDSIKRVEILSALQERLPNVPQIKPEHLVTLHNLRQIVAFLAGSSSSEEQPRKEDATPPVASPFEHAEPAAKVSIDRKVLRAVPLPSIGSRPAVRLEPGAEIWVTSDDAELANAVGRRLRHLGRRFRLLPLDTVHEQARQDDLSGLVLIAPAMPLNDGFLRNALLGVQAAATGLRRSGKSGGALLATVSRLDGAFGLCGIDVYREPLDAGLAGLTKTASHEWPEVHCKAIDLGGDFDDADAAAAALVDEMLQAGPLEVGLTKGGRCAPECIVQPLPANFTGTPLQPGDMVVVSGGARGVTAEVAVALAEAFRPTLVLLGRSPAPEPEPDWLARLTIETDIKRELGQRANGQVSLIVVGEQYQRLMAQREIRQTLARIRAAGARAEYHTVDVRNGPNVSRALEKVRTEMGPIRGLIHGAGVLADARIEDKTAQQFDRVYGTKVEGLRWLLQALAPADLRVLVLFSSSTARFGRTGQVDYAMANEVLNKLAQQQARRLGNCRVVAVNWGPLDGGMVTPALKRVFLQEGISLIGLKAGADYLVQEIRSVDERSVEVVIGAGDDSEAPTTAPLEKASRPVPPTLPTAFERVLDVQSHPVLRSHVLNGRPVLPMALVLEYLAYGALHQNPGLAFHGCDDFRILHGVILEDGKPLTLRVASGKAVKGERGFVAPVELQTVRADGHVTLNARAEVVLTTSLAAAPQPALHAAEVTTQPYELGPTEIYQDRLFHGPDLHGIMRVEGISESGIAALVRSAPSTGEWIRNPLRQQWLTDPLAVDIGFQLMTLWTIEQRGAASLPCFLRRYRQYRRAFPDGGVRILVCVIRAAEYHARADLEFVDVEGRLVARIEGAECVTDPTLKRAFERRVLTSR
jgi:acyl transferase domain-containing protein